MGLTTVNSPATPPGVNAGPEPAAPEMPVNGRVFVCQTIWIRPPAISPRIRASHLFLSQTGHDRMGAVADVQKAGGVVRSVHEPRPAPP